MSPFAVAAMNVVIVSTDWRGSAVRFGCWPAATSTIIVSPIARETPSTIEATMPDSAAGKTTRSDTWSLLAPSPNAPSRSDARHGRHRVLGDRGHGRQDHEAHDDAGRQGVERRDVHAEQVVEDDGREERQREVAEDDRRHAGEQLDERLDDPARARLGVLGKVDRGAEPERDRDDQRDARDEQRARDERQHAERRVGEQRRPLGAGEEVPDADVAEERDRLPERARR